jgi:HEAT repeat protein
MAIIQTSCPFCETTYKVPVHFLGKSVRCKQCQQSFPVQALREESKAAEAVVADCVDDEPPPPQKKSKAIATEESVEKPAPHPSKSVQLKTKAKPAPSDTDADEEQEEEGDDTPKPRPAIKSSGGLSTTTLAVIIGGGACALLFLGCAGFGTWYFFFSGNGRVTEANFDQLKLGSSLDAVEEVLGRGSNAALTDLPEEQRGPASLQQPSQWRRWANGKTVIVVGLTGSSPDTAKVTVLSYTGPTNFAGIEAMGSKLRGGTGEVAILPPPGPPVVLPPKPVDVPKPPPPPEFKPTITTAEDVTRNLTELKEGTAQRRREAADRFAKSSPELPQRAEVARALEPFLSDPDGGTRAAAARALAVWATVDNVPALLKAADTPDANVRGPVLEALAGLKDPRGATPIAARLTNDRGNAVRLLTVMGAVAEPAVLEYFHHPDSGVRDEARKLLKAYETRDAVLFDQTITDFKSTDVNRRIQAVRWLAAMPANDDKQKAVASALEPLVGDPNATIREEAGKALVAWAGADQVPLLIRLTTDPNVRLRRAAIEALGRLPDDKGAEAVALRFLDGGDRQHAAISLKTMGAVAEKPMIIALGNNDWGVRLEACHVLEVVGTKLALPALQLHASGDKNKEVAVAALTAQKAIAMRMKKP